VFLSLLLAAGSAPAAAADHVYRLSRESKVLRGPAGEVFTEEKENGTLYVSGSKVRFDQGEKVSWILDAGRSELVLVRHEQRLFHVLPVPFELEDFARTPEEKKLLENRKATAMSGIEVKPHEGKERLGAYEATRFDLKGQTPDGENRISYELWLSPDLPGEGLYRAILREFGGADLMLRPLARKMAELPGFPVLRRSEIAFAKGRVLDERKLVAVEEKPLPAATFAAPAGYRQEPFDLMEWLTPK
jgi:hypothetical protein